jgi:hypothetical protein
MITNNEHVKDLEEGNTGPTEGTVLHVPGKIEGNYVIRAKM